MDEERQQWNTAALRGRGWDAIVCASPGNVLLLSGYRPVLGTAIAITTRNGQTGVVAPEDERALVRHGWADESVFFSPGSLRDLRSVEEVVAEPLAQALTALGVPSECRLAFEGSSIIDTSEYAARFTYGAHMGYVIRRALPNARLIDGTDVLRDLRATLTTRALARVRRACRTVQAALANPETWLAPERTEVEVAADVRSRLGASLVADGFAWCMSGPNSVHASAAYQQSTERRLGRGDLVLVHCNSWHEGFWTDVTRTWCLGEPTRQQSAMYAAVLEAREAALGAIRPGVRACDVDAAARHVIERHGFGHAFPHATGHGVGYAAVDHNARPRIHPRSQEVLRPGMVFNVEPAVYLEGTGGLRHCDMVAITEGGCELLTNFQTTTGQLHLAVN